VVAAEVTLEGGAADPDGGASQSRDERARAALEPLGPGERPPVLLVAVVVAAALGVAIAVGTATIGNLHGHGGSVAGGVFLTALLLAVSVGLFRRRYWAVVGFEALLVFQILTATLALVLADSWAAAAGWLAAVVLGGLLFWKLIRVMARIQAGEVRSPQ